MEVHAKSTETSSSSMLLLRIVFVGLLAFTSPVTGVRGEWSLVGDYEYMVSPFHSTMSYREAQAYCKLQGLNGELAFVKSKEVQILIEEDVRGYLYGATYATISPPAVNYENTIPSEENDGEYNTFNRSGANPNEMKNIAEGTSQEAGSNSKYSTIEVREAEGYSRIHLNNVGEVDSTYNTLNETSKKNVIPLYSVIEKN